MSINAFIPFILGLFTLGTGIYTSIQAKKSYLSRPYLISSIAISFYFFLHFGLVQFKQNERILVPWVLACFTVASFIAPALINLLLSMRRVKAGLIKIILMISLFVGFSAFYFIASGSLTKVYTFLWGNVLSINNFAYFLFFVNISLFLPVAVVIFLIQRSSMDTSLLAKKQINFIVLGVSTIIFSLGINFTASFGLNVYPLGSLLLSIAFISMSYSILRYRSLEVDLIVNKTLLSLLFVGPLLVLHIIISAIFLKTLGFIFSTAFSMLLVIYMLLFSPYKKLIEKLVEKLIYRGKYDYQKVLHELGQSLTAILDFDQLFDRIIHIIVQTVDVEKMAIFLMDETTETLFLRTSYGIDQSRNEDFTLSADAAIVKRIKLKGRILVKGELRQFEDIKKIEQEFQAIPMFEAELIAPLFFKEHLLGLIVLSTKKAGNIYNQGDIDVLNVFAMETAKAIEHVRLYSEAIVDDTTTVFNQNYFLMRLREEIARSKRYGHSISLMFLDVTTSSDQAAVIESDMKDLLLKGVGLLLKTKVRNVDILARYSGLRFAVILPETVQPSNLTEEEKAQKHTKDTMIVAERLKTSIKNFKNKYKGQTISMDVKIGFACFGGANKQFSEETFINYAEAALQNAKKGDKDIICSTVGDE